MSKSFGDLKVIDDVSIEVGQGGVLALIGPSGAGKSTLLRCVNMLETPTHGVVEVCGTRLDCDLIVSASSLKAVRRSTGMVFQSFNLFPHMTIEQNVSFAQRRVLGRGKGEAESRSRELLEQVGLADKSDEYPGRCSGGQQQRAAIARALALEPQVMLFDEPTSALDPELGFEVLLVMRQLVEEGMTMIVVSHEMHFAREVADQIAVVCDGRIIERGVPQQVFNDPSAERTKRFLRAVKDR